MAVFLPVKWSEWQGGGNVCHWMAVWGVTVTVSRAVVCTGLSVCRSSLTGGPCECGCGCASGKQPRCRVAVRVPIAGTVVVLGTVGGRGAASGALGSAARGCAEAVGGCGRRRNCMNTGCSCRVALDLM